MLHPVFSYRYNWTIIILFWIIHALIPAALLHYYAQLDWQSALIDGGVYSLFLILVGIALWFPIGYGPQKISISKKVNQNLLTGLVAVAIWLLLSGLSCRVLLANNPAYSELAFNVYTQLMGCGGVYDDNDNVPFLCVLSRFGGKAAVGRSVEKAG